MTPDPILLELYRHRFSGIAEEMRVTLRRTSFSPRIEERRPAQGVIAPHMEGSLPIEVVQTR